MNLQLPPLWQPSWQWHGRALLIIYAVIIALFLVLRVALKPYVRRLPDDITPWLHGRSVPHSLH